MPTSDDPPDLLVDTSVAVALSVADHAHHDEVFRALSGRRLGLAGHAAFETYSVLTRMPAPARLTPAAALRVLHTNFPHTRFLGPQAAAELLASLATHNVAGGSVNDALVGAVAKEHGLPLATRDRRAANTYRALDLDVTFIDNANPLT
jgi:predicted nucleic acid-binding protein